MRPTLAGSLAITLLCLIWSSTWYAIRICLVEEGQPPLTSAALRFTVAAIAMVAVAPLLRARERAPAPATWLWVVSALTNFVGCYGIVYTAELVVPSGPAAVLWGTFPLLMAASGALFLGERLDARKALGTAVAFAGIVTVFAGNLGDIDSGNLGAALLLLASPLVCCVGTTLVKRCGSHASSVVLNRNGMVLGAAGLAALAFACEDPLAVVWTTRGLVALVLLATFGTTLTFSLYFWLLRSMPASRLSLINYAAPVIAMLLGWAMGDGEMDGNAWAGTVLVVLGIMLVVHRR